MENEAKISHNLVTEDNDVLVHLFHCGGSLVDIKMKDGDLHKNILSESVDVTGSWLIWSNKYNMLQGAIRLDAISSATVVTERGQENAS